jgi:hypothetical protein
MDMGLFSKKDEITKAVRRAKGKKDYNPSSEAKKVTKGFLGLFEPSTEKVFRQMEKRRLKNNRCAMVQDYHDV